MEGMSFIYRTRHLPPHSLLFSLGLVRTLHAGAVPAAMQISGLPVSDATQTYDASDR